MNKRVKTKDKPMSLRGARNLTKILVEIERDSLAIISAAYDFIENHKSDERAETKAIIKRLKKILKAIG